MRTNKDIWKKNEMKREFQAGTPPPKKMAEQNQVEIGFGLELKKKNRKRKLKNKEEVEVELDIQTNGCKKHQENILHTEHIVCVCRSPLSDRLNLFPMLFFFLVVLVSGFGFYFFVFHLDRLGRSRRRLESVWKEIESLIEYFFFYFCLGKRNAGNRTGKFKFTLGKKEKILWLMVFGCAKEA